MTLEICSNITGITTNPHNTALTPGGSSGGESAALQALYGSPLGIGSDIDPGGSIRSPAANCGLYGLKPSTGRLPLIGCVSYVLECETIIRTLRPISPTFSGIGLFMKMIIESKPWITDSMMLPIPWRDQDEHIHRDNKKLTVGVMWTDDVVAPAFPTPAPLHNTSRYWGYTSLFNLLDYSALVFPVTKVDPERGAKDATYTPKNEFDSWSYEHYDPVKQKDAPVSLQLVA
ncbi:hypothetical protein N7537_003081 [Penicillium hordei]|uniref:Amidase domain-containing protein n=1 Tax=Penicillium hordei TaxID=40994 RepID=A0AAD6MPA1_9EURO|nr:uncharacterized protein N7537_003081 [Penicillium hordei]KAJ5617967.1 hypothetical protein N7537_003081 [Penicillium hordei]